MNVDGRRCIQPAAGSCVADRFCGWHVAKLQWHFWGKSEMKLLLHSFAFKSIPHSTNRQINQKRGVTKGRKEINGDFFLVNSIAPKHWVTGSIQWLSKIVAAFQLWNVLVQKFQNRNSKNQIIAVLFDGKTKPLFIFGKLNFFVSHTPNHRSLIGAFGFLAKTLVLIKRKNNFIYFFVCCLIDNFTFTRMGCSHAT